MKLNAAARLVETEAGSLKALTSMLSSSGYNFEHLPLFIKTAYAWHVGKGIYSMGVNPNPALEQQTIDVLSAIGRAYPTKLPTHAYRMAHTTLKDPKKALGSKTLVIGPRRELSFSADPAFPKWFYKQTLTVKGKRRPNAYSQIVIEVPITKANYVTTTEACVEFIADVLANYKEIWNYLNDKGKRSVAGTVLTQAKAALKFLKSAIVKRQKEIILVFKTPKVKCEVLELLHWQDPTKDYLEPYL
jgi:hypothetical protein